MTDALDRISAGTGSLSGARQHARSQAGQETRWAPVIPSSRATLPAQAPTGAGPVWAETIAPWSYASRRLARGATLRIADPVGTACVQLLVHNARQPAERLNVADTVKVQWQAYPSTGAVLLSDMGRVLMTVTADTSAGHDCLCGCSVRARVADRYGDGHVGGRHPSGRDLLALGVAKFGLDRRDVPPSLNLFRPVRVDDQGALQLDAAARPGAHVDLRAEMDVIVTLANTPHPLDPGVDEPPEVDCVAWTAPIETGVADPFRTATPERERAFLNTDEYLLGWAG